jgi:hypothetical protein
MSMTIDQLAAILNAAVEAVGDLPCADDVVEGMEKP